MRGPPLRDIKQRAQPCSAPDAILTLLSTSVCLRVQQDGGYAVRASCVRCSTSFQRQMVMCLRKRVVTLSDNFSKSLRAGFRIHVGDFVGKNLIEQITAIKHWHFISFEADLEERTGIVESPAVAQHLHQLCELHNLCIEDDLPEIYDMLSDLSSTFVHTVGANATRVLNIEQSVPPSLLMTVLRLFAARSEDKANRIFPTTKQRDAAGKAGRKQRSLPSFWQELLAEAVVRAKAEWQLESWHDSTPIPLEHAYSTQMAARYIEQCSPKRYSWTFKLQPATATDDLKQWTIPPPPRPSFLDPLLDFPSLPTLS